jgi:hypothetical protein
MAASKTLRLVLGALSLALIGTAIPRTAHAQRVYVYGPTPPPRYGYGYRYRDDEPLQALEISGEIEGAVPVMPRTINSGNQVGGGGGFKLRVGEQLIFPGQLRFTPEVEYGFTHLWANTDGATDDNGNPIQEYAEQFQHMSAGARLGFGRFIVPTVYAHGGYGWRSTDNPAATGNGGLAFDVGAALDLRFRRVGVGVHAEYDEIFLPNESPRWVAAGVHLSLLF